MKRTLGPRDIDETIMKILLNLLSHLLEVLARVDVDGVRFVKERPAHRCFTADHLLLSCADGHLNIVGDQRYGASLIRQ